MRRHGHGGSDPACTGSGLLPFCASQVIDSGDQSEILDKGMCCSPSSSFHESSDSGSSLHPLQIPINKEKLFKRIPKAARHRAAVVFTACPRDVTKIGSASSWARLFFFAGNLRCPDRGSRRVNLSARVFAQLELLDSGQSPQPTSFLIRRGLSQEEVRVW